MKYMGVDEVKRGKERKIRRRQKENTERMNNDIIIYNNRFV